MYATCGRSASAAAFRLMPAVSVFVLVALSVPAAYLLLLALASLRRRPVVEMPSVPVHRVVVLIAAHDEARVIRRTLEAIHALDYPADLMRVHVIADHCTDETAGKARAAGAEVHERNTGPRGGKGEAIAWYLRRSLDQVEGDAVVIFDAETRPDSRFLRVMDAHLTRGARAIQGRHVIGNPRASWFASLMWAMNIIDNRFQNLGRANLGWSVKNMGDSICMRTELLARTGWGEGQADDHELRQRLLIDGVRIDYEPRAVAFGQAAPDWRTAWPQRNRWIQGVRTANRRHARQLAIEGIRRRDVARLEGAFQAFAPSYSTLTLLTALLLVAQTLVNLWMGPIFSGSLVGAWATLLAFLLLYPFAGLLLESAPARAYPGHLFGPAVHRLAHGDRPVCVVRLGTGGMDPHAAY